MRELNLVLYLERIYAELGCALQCITRESKDLPWGENAALDEVHDAIVKATQGLSVAQSMLRNVIEDRIQFANYFRGKDRP